MATNSTASPKIAARRHPLYQLFLDRWNKLADVREGTGGFMDGTYLVAHPREWLDHTAQVSTKDAVTGVVTVTTAPNPNPRKPSAKLTARRKLASYTNIGAAIIDAFKGPLFREGPNRRVGEDDKAPDAKETPIEQWWADCYHGQSMSEMMPTWWDLAATFGHIVLYFELPAAVPDADGIVATAADQAQPKIYWYPPRDVINWLEDEDGEIIAIQVLEAVPTASFEDNATVLQYRVREITETGWRLYDAKLGTVIAEGTHELGRLPCVYLFGQRSPTYRWIGKSILGDPQNHIDVFNLESEKRELLRGQTFSFMNIPLGTGDGAQTVEEAQLMMGKQTGTMNVIFSATPAAMLSADADNVIVYESAIEKKQRAMFREAGVQWETDSKDAEAQGSLSLKREEMNTRLSTMANECQTVEYELADLFYRWQYGADQGPRKLEDDAVTVQYPDRFEQTPFDDLITQIEAAQAIGMPASVLKELRKAILTKFEGMGTLPPAKLQKLLDEIDAAPDDPTPQERVQQRMQLMDKASKAGVKAPAIPQDPSKAAA